MLAITLVAVLLSCNGSPGFMDSRCVVLMAPALPPPSTEPAPMSTRDVGAPGEVLPPSEKPGSFSGVRSQFGSSMRRPQRRARMGQTPLARARPMYRLSSHRCPACNELFQKVKLFAGPSDVEVDFCPHCGSAHFDFEDGEPSALARALPDAGGNPDGKSGESGEAELGEPPCPRCRETMFLRAYLEGPTVYRCGVCLGTFVTRGQRTRLERFSLLPDDQPHREPKPILNWWETLIAFLF